MRIQTRQLTFRAVLKQFFTFQFKTWSYINQVLCKWLKQRQRFGYRVKFEYRAERDTKTGLVIEFSITITCMSICCACPLQPTINFPSEKINNGGEGTLQRAIKVLFYLGMLFLLESFQLNPNRPLHFFEKTKIIVFIIVITFLL